MSDKIERATAITTFGLGVALVVFSAIRMADAQTDAGRMLWAIPLAINAVWTLKSAVAVVIDARTPGSK